MDKLFGIPMDQLLLVLVSLFLIGVIVMAVMAFRNRVAFRLGIRNIPRRKTQTALIVLGLMLATLLFSASFATGDTLTVSIRQQALGDIGEMDEAVRSKQVDETGRHRYFDQDLTNTVRSATAGAEEVEAVVPAVQERVPVLAVGSSLSEPGLTMLGLPAEGPGRGLKAPDAGTFCREAQHGQTGFTQTATDCEYRHPLLHGGDHSLHFLRSGRGAAHGIGEVLVEVPVPAGFVNLLRAHRLVHLPYVSEGLLTDANREGVARGKGSREQQGGEHQAQHDQCGLRLPPGDVPDAQPECHAVAEGHDGHHDDADQEQGHQDQEQLVHGNAEELIHGSPSRLDGRRGRSPVAFYESVPHLDDPVGHRRHREVVRDQDERLAVFLIEGPEQLHDVLGVLAVQASGGFVAPDDGRGVDQGTGHTRPLLLAPGHFAGPLVQLRAQPHHPQGVGGTYAGLFGLGSRHQQGELHVLHRGEHRKQIEELEDKAHALRPIAGSLAVRHLLNRLSGDEGFSARDIIQAGEPIQKMSDRKRTRYRAERMGFVFQFFNLLPVLSAVENVELPLLVAGTKPKEARIRATDALGMVGLSTELDKRPGEMSGGQQQRASVARSLVNTPAIVWGDEPTGSLDSENSQDIMELLRSLNQEHGQTFILVTHDLSVAAMTDRIIKMRDGLIESDGRAAPSTV